MKLPKFQMEPLYYGYTFPQFITLMCFLGGYGLSFIFLVMFFGFINTLVIGFVLLVGPAVFFRVTQKSPEYKFIEKINFIFIKPMIHLPGRGGSDD